ncbi:head GIN domain-containing protein [Parabacteroides sp. PF5-9]|uniref:head GIN domain-containing protein n=1 Tax=Parabacteroides sp. PF5-9 TaxID=1742404 RepID=UPI0024746984|nr:head GIN domain-containing protein [Parabacteroides sp. PF5-9]MDH6357908.1 hypothetical protein [Parabacteroides sp. PF5-9]
MMKTKLVFLLSILFILPGSILAADPLKGNGHLTTTKIEIGDYNDIRIDGIMDFNFEQSDASPTLEITIDENLQQYVQTEVKDRILTIGFKKGIKVDQVTKFIVKTNSKWLKNVRVTGNAYCMVNSRIEEDELTIRANANSLVQFKEPVKVGRLEMKVTGSANLVISDLQTENIKCDLDGSGSIALKKGKAKEGKYLITGSGDIHAFDFEVTTLTCKMTGSGLAEIYATESLKTNVIGNGEICYKGVDPDHLTIIGKGKISPKHKK